jgi:hypothetical protein
MKSKKVIVIALLAFSFLAPLQLSSTASAESSDVLAKGELVRPGAAGYPRGTFCPPSMAAAGVTVPTTLGFDSLILNLRIECIDLAMLEKGPSSYSPYAKDFVGLMLEGVPRKTIYCPAKSLLSGFRMSTSIFVRDIAPVCSSYENGATTLEAKTGSVNGEALTSSSICPSADGKPTYVVGLEGYAGTGVDALGVLCGRTLKAKSKMELPTDQVLLAQYLPKGPLSTNAYLQPTSVNPYVNFSFLTQVGGDGSSDTDVFPFTLNNGLRFQPAYRYFSFNLSPSSKNVIVKITKITISSFSTPIGASPMDKGYTGDPAKVIRVSVSGTPSWSEFPISTTLYGLQKIELNYLDLQRYPSVKEATNWRLSFEGGTGLQYNPLSGRDGATGMMIYGRLIDNSPVAPEVPAVIKTPDAPTNFTYLITKDAASKTTIVFITVDVPKSLIGSVDRNNFGLISSELGYSEATKLIAGSVNKGKASFKFKLEDINLGKEVTFRIATIKDSVESAPLLKTIRIPTIIPTSSTPTPKATATPKSTPKATPKVIAPKAKSIKCSKAGVTRVFTATTCPPGYIKQ